MFITEAMVVLHLFKSFFKMIQNSIFASYDWKRQSWVQQCAKKLRADVENRTAMIMDLRTIISRYPAKFSCALNTSHIKLPDTNTRCYIRRENPNKHSLAINQKETFGNPRFVDFGAFFTLLFLNGNKWLTMHSNCYVLLSYLIHTNFEKVL